MLNGLSLYVLNSIMHQQIKCGLEFNARFCEDMGQGHSSLKANLISTVMGCLLILSEKCHEITDSAVLLLIANLKGSYRINFVGKPSHIHLWQFLQNTVLKRHHCLQVLLNGTVQ